LKDLYVKHDCLWFVYDEKVKKESEGFDSRRAAAFHLLHDIQHFDEFAAGLVHLKKPSGDPKGLIGPPCHGVLIISNMRYNMLFKRRLYGFCFISIISRVRENLYPGERIPETGAGTPGKI
jgi:hypothetical protein